MPQENRKKAIVAITLSVYNEEETLTTVLQDIRKIMDKTSYNYFIHVQDDGSTDRSLKISKEYADYVSIHAKNKGLAATFRDGITNCLLHGATIIVHTDGDGQYDLKKIPELIQRVVNNNDLVIGSRFLNGNRYIGKWYKGIANILFSLGVSILAGKKCSDVTSGFRAFNKTVAKGIVLKSSYTYTYEQFLLVAHHNFKITEVPVSTYHTRSSHLMRNVFHYMYHAFIEIMYILYDIHIKIKK